MAARPALERIDALVARAGLRLRGGFHPTPDDAVPGLGDGRQAGTLLLAGSVGGSVWPTFGASPEMADGKPDPLDRWTARVLGAIAGEIGAAALFPFGGPPYHPFQRWAMRAELVAPSPIGILIHPDYGLWHAYRGALALAEKMILPPRRQGPAPCETCAGRPCLTACPVRAFGDGGYDLRACVEHLDGPAGASCFSSACQARRACPIGPAYAYRANQSEFHMRAFRRAQRPPSQ